MKEIKRNEGKNIEVKEPARVVEKSSSFGVSSSVRRGLQANSSQMTSREKLWIEVKQQLWLALPMMGVNVVQSAIQMVSVMFVGHLGELQLAGSSIATSFANVTGFSLLMGLASALETLCGQAYGARQYHMVGIFAQRAMLVLTVVALPIAIVWFNMEQVLVLLGQSPRIAATAGHYARFMIPGLLAYPFLQPLNKFLQSQGLVLPIFLCSSFTLGVHTLVCWTFVYKVGMGNRGAALATSISNWLDVFFLSNVVWFVPRARACWPGFSKEAFWGIKQFLDLAIPSAVMMCLEWWCWEVLVLLSGTLPNPELEASMFSIMFNTWPVLAMFPISLGTAASIRVSNELGAGNPETAKFSFRVALGFAVFGAILLSTAVFTVRNLIGKIFSNDRDVIDYVSKMFTFIAAYPIVSAFQGASSGTVRGSGRQTVAAIVDLGAYYLVGLPLAYLLAFRVGLRGEGLIFGMLGGDAMQAFIFFVIAARTKWDKEAFKAKKRLDASESVPLLQ